MISEKLQSRKIITVEILLPVSGPISGLYKEITPLQDYIDALNIPSNPLGKLRPDALCCAHLIQEKTGIETIPHFVARHYTSLAFESHLLGAAALGIENILCVTGDNPVRGRSAFELNSSRLICIAKGLKQGITSSRKAIPAVDFCLCTSFNPNVPNIHGEFIKAAAKCEAGAEVFFTQPIFDPVNFLKILKEFRMRHKDVKVIAGLSFLHSKKRAFSLMKFLGIPYDYINNIEERNETEMLLENVKILKEHINGFYIIPIGRYGCALDLARAIRSVL
ncbi:MAG TPA: hypothetical protein ENI34_09605 [candidate division WOR-3 bacterium]|uniref:Methylenetetrahydrofolate reductase n=1 Tax=candidate division WOR-3 bacterium TaxID=2052148 RepID=A0A9C9ENJ9_UNCW3|nr:hypothetical protein [candidate division WOR-3 bacterium]